MEAASHNYPRLKTAAAAQTCPALKEASVAPWKVTSYYLTHYLGFATADMFDNMSLSDASDSENNKCK